MGTRGVWSLLALGASVVALLMAGACGAAEAPTTTPTTAPQVVSSPTPTATPAAPRVVATPTPVPALTATPSPTGPQPKYGGVAVFATRGDPPGAWDSMRTETITLGLVAGPMYDRGNLLRPCRGNSYLVCPALAEKWESNADFTQWTFTVRQGVLWHDGRPFTAQDALWWTNLSVKGAKSGDKVRQPSVLADSFGPLEKAEVVDGNKIRFTLSRSAAVLPSQLGLSQNNNIAHPPHLMQPQIDKGNVSVAPQEVGWVATGPFKMHRYDRGSIIQVRRFDQYWGKDEQGRKLPFLDGIDFPIINNPSSSDAAFRTGRVDGGVRAGGGFYLTNTRKATIEKEMGDKVWFADMPGNYKILVPNVLRSTPWQDVRVRKAMSLWMDRPAGIEATQGGFGSASTFFAPKSPWTNPDFATWPGYNPATRDKDRAEAKRLLAEAGYPTGFSTTLLCRAEWVAYCEYTEGQLSGLGIQVKLDVVDEATRTKRNCTGDFTLIWHGPGPIFPEAWEGSLSTAETNPCADLRHNDKKVNEFFVRLGRTTNFEERVKIARELERYIVLEQALGTFLWVEVAVTPYRSYVKGMYVPLEAPSNDTDFTTVWLDK